MAQKSNTMLRRVAAGVVQRHEVLREALAAGALQALDQARAVHASPAAQLANQPPSSHPSNTDASAPPPGGSESVVLSRLAKAAAAAGPQPGGGVPLVTKLLGFAGALPFWVFSPAVAPLLPLDVLVDPGLLANPGLLQVGYGATILSFLGGVHWGLAMTNVGGDLAAKMADQRYLWSVLPCLMAWPTVALPVPHAAGIQAALLGAVYLVDRAWAGKGMLPPWYMRMRLPLTLLAAGGLGLTASTG